MAFQARPSVLWREGLFLCPQHLQAYAREVTDRIHAAESIGAPGDWGLIDVQLDEEALRRDTFRLLAAEVVFPDGTLAAFPVNAIVAQRDFIEFFVESELDVYLGIPAVRLGAPALSEDGAEEGARYRVQPAKVFDENLAASERELDFKLLQARLFFGEEDRTGYECVPIARLVRKGKPETYSALSDTFIPPALACKASPVLTRELSAIAAAVREQARDLAARIPQTTLLSSVEKGADVAAFVKLQAVNQCIPGLDMAAKMPDLHPFFAYNHLIQAIGSLAIFGDSRTVPELASPGDAEGRLYVHEDLNGCFSRAIEVARDLIPREVSVPYDTAAFVDDPTRPGLLVCDIPANWLSGDSALFLGVKCDQSAEEVARLVPKAVKLCSNEDLEAVLTRVVTLIELEHVRIAPLSFPKGGAHYFRISSEGNSRKAWLRIAEERKALLVRTDPTVGSWQFGLYVELRG